jgi:DUF438 domain-containing protein
MKREDILKEIIKEQHRVIQSLKDSVDGYKTASDMDEDMQLRFEKMLQKEKNDLEFVLNEMEKSYTEIEFGAIVETDKNYFFLAVPLPKLTFGGKELFCISKDAPIFSKLKGQKIGASIEVGNTTHTIVNIL